MITDNTALGLGLEFNHVNSKRGELSWKTTEFGLQPFLKFHFKISEKFKYYLQPNIRLLLSSTTDGESNNPDVFQTVGINAGILYFVSNKVAIDVNFGGINYMVPEKLFVTHFNFDNPAFGLRFYI